MNYGTYRDLLFLIIPSRGVIEEATGWDIQDDAATLKYPNFPNDFSEIIPFYSIYELEVVRTVFNALKELSAESRELKLAACRERKKSKPAMVSGYIPLEFSPRDYKFWTRKSIWTPDEAALLSLGFIPTDSIIHMMENLDTRSFSECPLLKEFRERTDLIVVANRSGQLGSDGHPMDLIEWFTRLEFELPKGFAESVSRIQSTEQIEHPPHAQERQYSDREKETLLKLVAAMGVKGYRFDPALKRNAATADIRSDLELLGFSMDDNTILKWLRAATDLVDKDYWDKS